MSCSGDARELASHAGTQQDHSWSIQGRRPQACAPAPCDDKGEHEITHPTFQARGSLSSLARHIALLRGSQRRDGPIWFREYLCKIHFAAID
ncbi:hypothetical protein K443DRAFT_260499 [Laccaria amethystina LaAM-08-1]|uniref:Unplaced genomic scaffold K443scaffold_168, whole genome shotgun sequence n=1 Tax=Laccaria amethystina LaAM-08-1 TaxID=1095629 RepID=A0A0C9WWR1_9AGAR|nr:hypothetical protein K443DRAFT_260499 [Laccaria amethystina LaAM-08-1]